MVFVSWSAVPFTLPLLGVSDAGVSGLPRTAKLGFRFLCQKTVSVAFAPVVCLVLFPGSFSSRLSSSAVFLPRLRGAVLQRSGVRCQCLICDADWTKLLYQDSFLSFFFFF